MRIYHKGFISSRYEAIDPESLLLFANYNAWGYEVMYRRIVMKCGHICDSENYQQCCACTKVELGCTICRIRRERRKQI